MTEKELTEEYYEWMCQLIYDEQYYNGLEYERLISYLHNVNFSYVLGADSNRAEDGVNFRYRFGYELGYQDAVIAAYLDNQDCSVLEMMLALAVRCEDHIMADPSLGNRTALWFWNMVSCLGLNSMTDDKFDIDYVENVICIFMNRQYEKNGNGSLFKLNHCTRDLRNIEIWYQMCWYLDENFAN